MTEERKQKLTKVLQQRQTNITVVMENVHDPHNISAVMRTCDAVGIQNIYILNTKIPKHKKWGAKSSSSAMKWLTIHEFDNAEKCFESVRRLVDKIFVTYLNDTAVSLYDIDFTKSIALVFGNEHDGVSEEIRKFADGNFVIPQVGIIQSLNVSVACAVSVYEAFRQKQLAQHYNQTSFHSEQIDALMKEWNLNHDE